MKLLTQTSAMPCPSWSLPAWETCPGARYAATLPVEDQICSSCYARKGFYRMPNVSKTQKDRLSWTKTAIEKVTFVRSLTEAIRETGTCYFRVHDSGDFFSFPYLYAWTEVCPSFRT